jgi:hypothetical protein
MLVGTSSDLVNLSEGNWAVAICTDKINIRLPTYAVQPESLNFLSSCWMVHYLWASLCLSIHIYLKKVMGEINFECTFGGCTDSIKGTGCSLW